MPATHFADRSSFRRASPFNKPFRRVPGDGPLDASIFLIGEKPGREEAQRGKPFVGPSGQYLNRFLEVAGLSRSEVFCTNLVREFTDFSKPTAAEIARDHQDLVDELLSVNPEIVGLVGAYAVEHILAKSKADMDRTHGCPIKVDALFGGELPRKGGWIVMPILHPANALHNPDSMPALLDDFLQLGRLADGEITIREDDPYAGHEDYRDFYGDELTIKVPCACDTEGSQSRPWCATISTDPGKALLVKPGQGVIFQDHVFVHNYLHDAGVLRSMGIELKEDGFTDTMLWAYLLCCEPQALKSLAYRYCGAERKSYDEMVSPAQERRSLEYLENVLTCADGWPIPEQRVIVEGGKPRLYKPQSITKRVIKIMKDFAQWKSGEREEPVDLLERWKSIDDELKIPVVEALGNMPHADLGDIDYTDAQRYACNDASDTLRIAPVLASKIKAMGLEEASRIDHEVMPMVERMQSVGIQLAPKPFWDEIEQECEAQMDKAKWKIFEATGHEINPGSGDQVADLLYNHLGLVPPKLTDSGNRGSTNDKCLENLLAHSPVAEYIMDYREGDKIRGTYVVPLRKICQTGDGRVRANFRITRVVSGRLSTADPNLLAIPVRSKLGKKIREGFIAPDGYVLGDWDLDQIEMRVEAHESRDENMCRIFNDGKYDIHSMTAAQMFGVSVNNIDKKDYRRQAGKIVGFFIINGGTATGLVDQMIIFRATKPDGSRWTEDDCENMLTEWFRIYPGVKRFQQESVREAEETGLSRESIGGRIRYLPGIWSPIRSAREEAGRCSYSHKISSGAQSLMKKGMKQVWDSIKYMQGYVEPILQVHDENLLQVDDDEDTKVSVNEIVVRGMESAVTLRVPVIASGNFGRSWAEAH